MEMSQNDASAALPQQALLERTAQIAAHRVCCGTEHDAANGKLHGYCVVCGVPWPCEYAGKPPVADVSAIPPTDPRRLACSCGRVSWLLSDGTHYHGDPWAAGGPLDSFR
jgi:hypothetical protein